MTKFFELQFEKPGRRENFDYPDMVKEAVTKALKDAKITINQVNQATVGYVYGKLTHLHVLYVFVAIIIYNYFRLHFVNSMR